MEKLTSLFDATPLRLLGVGYLHMCPAQGGDLYLTKFGAPFAEHLQPENWLQSEWFKANRERLPGTGTVYRVPTKEEGGRSIDLVVKYCRVGEEVPVETMGFEKFWDAEFNSPYEEFSLLMEMRETPSADPVFTHRPLAIYVPPERLKLWQTGRSKDRIQRKTAKFRDVELDILRQYILVYEWIKGLNAPDALEPLVPDVEERKATIKRLADAARTALAKKGFMVVDHKSAHVILRPRPDGTLLQDRSGEYAYALVDFELLARTPKQEQKVKDSRRTDYLWHQGHRFAPPSTARFPEHLKPARVFDVDYVYGHAESTHGFLWVVGKDPNLFDYFLPERWRHTPSKPLSDTSETFYTVSKDNVLLVW